MDIFPWGYNASALFQNAEKHQQDVVEWLELSFYIPFQGCYIKLSTYTYLENPLTKYMSYRHKPKSIFSFFYIPHHLKKVVGRKKKNFWHPPSFLRLLSFEEQKEKAANASHRVPFLEVKLEVDKKPGRLTQMQRPFWFKKRRRRSCWLHSIGHHVRPHNVIKHFFSTI